MKQKRRNIYPWLASALSFAASVVFAVVLVVESVNFRDTVHELGDDDRKLAKMLDICEVVAGLAGAFAVSFIALTAYRLKLRLKLVAAENEQIRRTEEVRREFVADITHALRTPLTGLMAAAEILRDGAHGLSEEEKRTLFNVILTDSRRLDALASDIAVCACAYEDDRTLRRMQAIMKRAKEDGRSVKGDKVKGEK